MVIQHKIADRLLKSMCFGDFGFMGAERDTAEKQISLVLVGPDFILKSWAWHDQVSILGCESKTGNIDTICMTAARDTIRFNGSLIQCATV